MAIMKNRFPVFSDRPTEISYQKDPEVDQPACPEVIRACGSTSGYLEFNLTLHNAVHFGVWYGRCASVTGSRSGIPE